MVREEGKAMVREEENGMLCEVCAAGGAETPAVATRLTYRPDIAGAQPGRIHLCDSCLAQCEAIYWDPTMYIPRSSPWRTGRTLPDGEEWAQDGDIIGRPVRAYWVAPPDAVRAWPVLAPEESVRHEWTDSID